MHDGRAAEFDTPQELLTNEGSIFYSLVNRSEEGHNNTWVNFIKIWREEVLLDFFQPTYVNIAYYYVQTFL